MLKKITFVIAGLLLVAACQTTQNQEDTSASTSAVPEGPVMESLNSLSKDAKMVVLKVNEDAGDMYAACDGGEVEIIGRVETAVTSLAQTRKIKGDFEKIGNEVGDFYQENCDSA